MSEQIWQQLRAEFIEVTDKHHVDLDEYGEMVCAVCRVVKYPTRLIPVPWPCDTRLAADKKILRAVGALPAA